RRPPGAPGPRAAIRRRVGAGRARDRDRSRDRGHRARLLTEAWDQESGPSARCPLPAPGVPVPPLLWRAARHHHLVTEAGRDLVIAARAAIRLHGLVRLHVLDLDVVVLGLPPVRRVCQPNTAHSTSAAITTNAAATIKRSVRRVACGRNGLKPTGSP